MATIVKIFGERNSGTNALTWLVRQNSSSLILPSGEFDLDAQKARHAWEGHEAPERERLIDQLYEALPDRLSWKHCATHFDSVSNFEHTLVLICIRHPASWLVGLYRNPYHILSRKPGSLEEFLNCEWKTVRRERLGGASIRPLDLYNEKLTSYLSFANRLHSAGIASAFVRHEDLLLRPKQAFASIRSELSEPRKLFRPRLTSTKHRAPHDPNCRDYPSLKMGTPLFLMKRYYKKEVWRESLRGLEKSINSRVSWDLVGGFGYEPV